MVDGNIMRRKRQNPFEDIIELTARVPWWIGVLLAITSFFILNYIAGIKVIGSMKPGEIGNFVLKQMAITFALFGQFVLPVAFLFGSVLSVIQSRKRQTLMSEAQRNTSAAGLNGISWSEFEVLVGEYFRRKGYSVVETGGGGSSDGGVDLELKKNKEKFLVQCKQWRAYKVSVNTVRELYGVMAARGATGGFVVTSGRFTEDAKTFAAGRNIELIDGKAFDTLIKSAHPGTGARVASTIAASQSPACPVCSSSMIKRTAKHGATAGSQFWGCPKYPNCRGTLPI